MRKSRAVPPLFLTLFALFTLILASAPAKTRRAAAAPEALPWARQTLAETGDVGEYPSLALDDQGYPHLSYYSAQDRQLHYLWLDAEGPHDVLLDGNRSGVGKFSSLALDAAGRAHISYYDEDYDAVKYATYPPLIPPQEFAAFSAGESETSLALDKNGRPLIAYYDDHEGSLKVTRRLANGTWQVETADSGTADVGIDPSLALDQDGYPHISYYDVTNADLKYVAKDTSGWQDPQIVDAGGSVGLGSSLALDTLGRPFISYWDWIAGDLLLATRSPTRGWVSEALYTKGNAGRYSALALDASGRPHISFYDESNGRLIYASRRSDGSWTAGDIVDDRGDAGIDVDLALDPIGNPHMVYYDGSGGDLEYAFLLSVQTGLTGNVRCEWGESDCNPCVSDVENAFKRLRTQGDILAFDTAGYPDAYWGVGTLFSNHWQGVQRLSSGGGQAFVTTLDNVAGTLAVFNVARMTTRDSGGGRWRSNLLAWDRDFADTVPSSLDRVVKSKVLPSKGSHPGGIQAMGDYLAIGAGSEFFLYDMQDPWQPQRVGGVLDRDYQSSSTSALAQLYDGRWLAAISDSDAASVDFYFADKLDPATWKDPITYVPPPYTYDQRFFYHWDTFQNINLVSDCGSGDLYLLATGNLDKTSTWNWQVPFDFPHWPNGEDWASLYHLSLRGQEMAVEKVAERHFYCGYRGETYCNFDAAAGAYVDDNHQLYLYSTEHRSDGAGDTVKAMEFRPMPHGSCAVPQDGWVELFEGPSYNGRSLMIDWIDRDKENYENYDEVEDFEDRAQTAAWCLPHDWSMVLYQDKNPCSGKEVKLNGTGAFRQASLSAFGSWNQVSCSRFVFDPPRTEVYRPDLGVTIVYYPPGLAAGELDCLGTAAAEREIRVRVPAGALGQTLNLTLAPASPPGVDPAPLASAGMGFTLSADDGGVPVNGLLFNKPATVTLEASPADMEGLVGGSQALYYWDETAKGWQPAADTCAPDLRGSTQAEQPDSAAISGQICKLGEYALLAEPERRLVLVDELHDNTQSLNWSRAQEIAATIGYEAEPEWFYLDALRDALAQEFELRRLASGKLTAAKLAGADVLLVPPYRQALTDQEVRVIREFVAGGGSLIFEGEAGYTAPNPSLEAGYGIKRLPLPLFGPAPENKGDIVVQTGGEHPALSGVSEMTLNWSQPLSLSGKAEPIARTPPDTWLDVDDDVAYSEDVDFTHEFISAAAVDTGCGRVAALGDNSFSDGDLSWTDNEAVMAALLRWAAAGRDCPANEHQRTAVLLDESHDGTLTLDWGRAEALAAAWGSPAAPEWFYLGELDGYLAADFTLDQTYGAPLTEALLAGYETLILPVYSEPLSAAEETAVRRFVASGGGLVILGICDYQPPNPGLPQSYGLGFNPACLYSPTTGQDQLLPAGYFGGQSWLQGIDPLQVIFGQTLDLSAAAESFAGTAGLDAWRDENGSGAYDVGEEGIFDVAGGADTGCGRVAAVATDAFANASLDMLQGWENDVFMRALLGWTSGGQRCTVPQERFGIFMPLVKGAEGR